MDVGRVADPGQGQELLPGPGHLSLDVPEAPKRPALEIDAGSPAVGEHGPLGGEGLPRGQPVGERGIGLLHSGPPRLPPEPWPFRDYTVGADGASYNRGESRDRGFAIQPRERAAGMRDRPRERSTRGP